MEKSKQSKQDTTSIIIYGGACDQNIVYKSSPEITIWYHDDNEDNEEESPNIMEHYIYIVNDYLTYLVKTKHDFPGILSIPIPEYTMVITKVKGNKAWSHEYIIDPIKLLKKFGPIDTVEVSFKK